MPKEFDVAICGAGPAGAALANIFASRGIETALIERQSDFSKEFRGEGIMPTGYQALKDIGFDLRKIEIPMEINNRITVFYRGIHLIDPTPPGFEDGLIWVSQPALLEHMIQESKRNRNFTFYKFDLYNQFNKINDLCKKIQKKFPYINTIIHAQGGSLGHKEIISEYKKWEESWKVNFA